MKHVKITRYHRKLQAQLDELVPCENDRAAILGLIHAVNDSYREGDRVNRRLRQADDASKSEPTHTSSEISEVLGAIPDLLFRISADNSIYDLRHRNATETTELLRQFAAPDNISGSAQTQQFDECLRTVRETHRVASFIVCNSAMSRDVYYEIRLMPMRNDDVVGIARDITAQRDAEVERELAEERLRLQAYHDPLTGLPNRTLFQQALERAISEAEESGRQVAVLFLDLDRFKHVNDLLGHAVGDVLLQEVAARLTHGIDADYMLARMGGDEFTILIPSLDSSIDPQETAARLLDSLEPPFDLGDHELFVSGSIGISIFPSGGRASQVLLQHADIAMYRTKARGGRGFSLYADGVDSKTTERIRLENNLRRALAREEFILHYQPLVRLTDSAIVGFEALIRWNHPEYGMIAPAEFIQLTEETGLIMKLGEWVIKSACRQAAQWEARGNPMRIAVNLSAKQFDAPGLPALVAKVVEDVSLTPSLLELELTEGTVLNHDRPTIDTLNALRAIGVRLSIDDFGTGYSSLSQLRQLPFDVLKIDRSFLKEIGGRQGLAHRGTDGDRTVTEPTSHSIIRAIVEIAHALGLEIVAEGVETEEQREVVQRLGCDIIQGFLFSKPLPASQIERLLDEPPPWTRRKAA